MNDSRPILTVISSADQRFTPGLEVALASAVAAASGSFDYDLRVLDGGLDLAAIERLGDTLSRIGNARGIQVTLSPLPVDLAPLEVLPARRGSRMFYAKLLLPQVLPEVHTAIYLDADVLCFQGIEEIYADPDQYLLAGATDYFDTIRKDCPWLDRVPEVERDLPYINSGVMWLNLDGLREMHFTETAIACRAEAPNARFADQAVFNFLCRGKIRVLPQRINHRTSIGSARPLLAGDLDLNLHCIGSPKPWLGSARTSNWLAHRLWHLAREMLILPGTDSGPAVLPADRHQVRTKCWLYTVFNPARGASYRADLRSLFDPGGVIESAAARWKLLGGT